MKKLAVLSVVALSLGSLCAVKAQSDPASQAPEAGKPLPPIDSPQTTASQGGKFGRHAFRKNQAQPGQPGGNHAGPGSGSGAGARAGMGEKQMFAQALHLTPDQKEKAKAIMGAARPKIQAARSGGKEQVKAAMKDAMQQLRAILTPEQQQILDDMLKLRADQEALKAASKSGAPATTTGDQKPR